MTGWEYMVIHINVEPPAPAAAGGAAGGAGSGAGSGGGGAAGEGAGSKPVFSRSFLAKEFPQFYEGTASGAPPPAKPQHPAQQLQAFLNSHGSQGWELLGVFPVGAMSMLVFRRLLPAAPGTPAITPARTPASTTASTPANAIPSDAATLQAVLARLEALERRSAMAAAPAAAAEAITPDPVDAPPLVPPTLLARLGAQPTVGSAAAAQAIGLRSAGSLANLGARHGYQPGLVKRGANGLAAVYHGVDSTLRGGKPQRLWWVVPIDQLDPPG